MGLEWVWFQVDYDKLVFFFNLFLKFFGNKIIGDDFSCWVIKKLMEGVWFLGIVQRHAVAIPDAVDDAGPSRQEEKGQRARPPGLPSFSFDAKKPSRTSQFHVGHGFLSSKPSKTHENPLKPIQTHKNPLKPIETRWNPEKLSKTHYIAVKPSQTQWNPVKTNKTQ